MIKLIDKSIIQKNTYHFEVGIVWISEHKNYISPWFSCSIWIDIHDKEDKNTVGKHWCINCTSKYQKINSIFINKQQHKKRNEKILSSSLADCECIVSYYALKQWLDFIGEKKNVIVRLSLTLSENVFFVWLFWWNVCKDINKSNSKIQNIMCLRVVNTKNGPIRQSDCNFVFI